MAKFNRFRMAMGLLLGILAFFSLDTLSPPVVFAQSSNRLAARIDSLTKTQQQTAATLREAVQKLNEMQLRMNYEIAANHERIESFKETTNQLFWLFVVIGTVATIFGALVTLRSSKQQSELHGKVLRIYESQAVVGERYRDHSGQILDSQDSYSRGMAEITTAFKDILENVQSVLGFRVKEGKMALEAMQAREEAARVLPEIQKELAELRKERDAQMDDLLTDTSRHKRSRHEFTEPDRELSAAIFQFRIKMDGMSKLFLDKYADQPKYAPVFYYRGVIAFIDSDVLTAYKMLSLSEKLMPFTETGLKEMSRDLRIHAAFTQFYLALIHKNYGHKNYDAMRTAHDHIAKSYRMYGQDEKSEILTLVTFAEILSYLPDLDTARSYLKELFDRVELKVKSGSLTKAEAQYIPRGHLVHGNTFFVEKRWEEARKAYNEVLEINKGSYYAHHSLGQILKEEGNPQQAQAAFDKALQGLLESKHLELKPERGTQITLNALAYLCLREVDPAGAKLRRDAVNDHLTKVREIDGFEIKLFSFKKKRPVSHQEFLNELID